MLKTRPFSMVLIIILTIVPAVIGKVKVKKLLIASEVNGWVEQKEITRRFTAKQLFEIINGGAVEYINQGMIEGIHQQFTSGGDKTVEVFVEDFGTAEKSSAMLAFKKDGFTDAEPISGLPGILSFKSKAIGALVVIASIGNFYVEMTISGFADNDAVTAAKTFLHYYQKLIQ